MPVRNPIQPAQGACKIQDELPESLGNDVVASWSWRHKSRKALQWLMPASVAIAVSGCGAKLPDCLVGLKSEGAQKPSAITKRPQVGQQVLIGIDGSGSMLGFSQASNKSIWPRFLQSINQGILLKGLKPVAYRIGAGIAEGPLGGSVTQAADPCFFIGCEGFKPVASSLGTLWTIQSVPKKLPLRLLVSDLEVNQDDVTSLVSSIQVDLIKGASAGVLGLRAPFTGDVYGVNGKIIYKGNTNRPLFILATGPREQVKSILNEIKKTMALKGISNTRVSMIEPVWSTRPLDAQWVSGIPTAKAKAGRNILIDNKKYGPAKNTGYQFIVLNSGSTGLTLRTSKKWSEGSKRPDFGIADLERLSVTSGQPQPADGMRISNIEISGSNIRVWIDVDQSAATGAYRVVIPAGSKPEQWWLEWDRPQSDTRNLGEKTQGLLLLMTTLRRQLVGSLKGPPEAAMCVALQNQT